jgi:hypothetical protein
LVWARLRAALITLAMAVGLVAGLPVPGEKDLARLPGPLRPLAAQFGPVQAFLMQPFRFIGDWLFIGQRWNLFAGAKTDRYWLLIEGQARDGKWLPLYRPHDPSHALFADELEYRRLRAAWNPRGSSATGGYDPFVTFIARRIFAAKPEISAVRVRLEAIRIRPRGDGFDASGEFSLERVRSRSDVGQ